MNSIQKHLVHLLLGELSIILGRMNMVPDLNKVNVRQEKFSIDKFRFKFKTVDVAIGKWSG